MKHSVHQKKSEINKNNEAIFNTVTYKLTVTKGTLSMATDSEAVA